MQGVSVAALSCSRYFLRFIYFSSYFGQICEGLNYLHSRGIIHRDIKSDNVLVSHLNQLKLADFGVCQNVDLFSDNDMVGGNDGTPLYHSPEMFDPQVMNYSGTKVDIWAAAVILYQMVTSEVPFFKEGLMTDEEHFAILHKMPDYPPNVREDILLQDLLNSMYFLKANFTAQHFSCSSVSINCVFYLMNH